MRTIHPAATFALGHITPPRMEYFDDKESAVIKAKKKKSAEEPRGSIINCSSSVGDSVLESHGTTIPRVPWIGARMALTSLQAHFIFGNGAPLGASPPNILASRLQRVKSLAILRLCHESKGVWGAADGKMSTMWYVPLSVLHMPTVFQSLSPPHIGIAHRIPR